MKSFFLIFILLVLFSCDSTDSSTLDLKEVKYPDCFSNIDTTNLDKGSGCGSIFLYKELSEGVITVNFDPNTFMISQECRTFELNHDFVVNLEIYPTKRTPKDSIRTIDYCGCVKFMNAQKRIKIRASKGTITFSIKPGTNNALLGDKITAVLNNVEFKHPKTREIIKLDNIIFWDVNIGWFVG